MLKFLVGADAETDSLIDDAMEVGRSVIFNRYPPYSGAHFVSQPATICQQHRVHGRRIFKERPTMKSLKAMFDKECCASSSSATPSSVTPQRSRLLAELSLSDEESESMESYVEDEQELETVKGTKRKTVGKIDEKEQEVHRIPEEEEPQQQEEQITHWQKEKRGKRRLWNWKSPNRQRKRRRKRPIRNEFKEILKKKI